MKVIVITGQTATGKTSLALKYAKKYDGDLINADSRQIYAYLDVITGKDKQLVKKTNVWLYDVIKPNEYFSSYDYVKYAVPIIQKVIAAGKTPIIVGGSYLYLKHLLYGFETEHIVPNWQLRKTLENSSVAQLQKNLQQLDSQSFNRLNNSDKNNPQRLIRKIEIVNFRIHQRSSPPERWKNQLTRLIKNEAKEKSNSLSERLTELLNIPNLQIDFIGLKFKEKETLKKAITLRVNERLKQGAVNEVEKLLRMGYKDSDPGMRAIGYQQLLLHLKGGIDIDTAIEQWINKEIQYAKRQFTFMKKDRNIKWQLV